MNKTFKLAAITALALVLGAPITSAQEETTAEKVMDSTNNAIDSTREMGGEVIDNTSEAGKSAYEQTKETGGKIIDNLGETADSTGHLVKKMYTNTKENLSGK